MTEDIKTKDDAVQAQKQKELQQKFMEYQMMEQQLKQVQEQMEKLDAQSNEVKAVEQSIADIGKASPGDEVLVPVSGGIFFRATIKDSKDFLVNVGSNVVVTKDIEGTSALVHKQGEEVEKYKMMLSQQMEELMANHQKLEDDLKNIIED